MSQGVKMPIRSLPLIGVALLCSCAATAPTSPVTAPAVTGSSASTSTESQQDVLARSKPADWRAVDPQNTLYMELPGGRVVIELAPEFAPRHVANIKTLVRQHYFDGLAIVRAQDDYVVQWDDPDGKRDKGAAAKTVPSEYDRSLRSAEPFRPAPDGDVYAPQVGFVDSWPVARNAQLNKEWLLHCYGMVGAGREEPPDTGSGAELYAVIGHSPRQLDRNVALTGRVLQGIELLSTLPRGTGNLSFYEKQDQLVPIRSIRIAADLPPAERTEFEVLRSDAPIFADYVRTLRTRQSAWFVEPTNRIEICNIHIPARPRSSSTGSSPAAH
jgi:peptidylprolyl isomerase